MVVVVEGIHRWRCLPWEAFHYEEGSTLQTQQLDLLWNAAWEVSPGKEGIILRTKWQTQDFWSQQKRAHIDYQAHPKSTKKEHRK